MVSTLSETPDQAIAINLLARSGWRITGQDEAFVYLTRRYQSRTLLVYICKVDRTGQILDLQEPS